MTQQANALAAPVRGKQARPWYVQLWFQVLVAMVVGIALGHLYPNVGAQMQPLGDAFIKAIRVLIAPIIFCTVVRGISSMANMAKCEKAVDERRLQQVLDGNAQGNLAQI
jgi:aerobic C4-dicarboxylate transport protein